MPGSLSSNLNDVVRTLSSRATAPDQGGLFSGVDPTAVNLNDPIRLWIIQLVVIVGTSQLLGWGLRKIKQPSVIAEVLGGIILGPTAMGRVPGFTKHIFPAQSLPFLSLVANIGLVLFLFLVGLEIDFPSIKRNARTSAFICIGGIGLPFGIGAGMSRVIYKHFIHPVDPNTKFSHFMVFTCVSYSITAFPVLCRILTALKLLDTKVGVCALSAGVGSDLVGWTLLALSVALVNATSPLTTLWTILLAIAWIIFILIPCRWAFAIFARRTRSIDPEIGPSPMFVTGTLMFVFASAWFTDVIGIQAIFGGFLAGLAVPRTGGLAIKMTEKIEDLVAGVFLPIYFTLSGLSTNLGLLNTGEIWGYTIAIMVTDWCGKFTGASIGARLAGLNKRESATIGSLMSCKGLVELIVLNVGLQAGILPVLVFSMFVLEALTLTFITTPFVEAVYPPKYRIRFGSDMLRGPNHNDVPPGGLTLAGGDGSESIDESKKGAESPDNISVRRNIASPTKVTASWMFALKRRRFTFVLDKLEHLPGIISMTELLSSPLPPSATSTTEATTGITVQNVTHDTLHSISEVSSQRAAKPQSLISLSALRLVELSDRTSAVMKSSAISSLIHTDPLLNVVRTVGETKRFAVRGRLEVVSEDQDGWAKCVSERAEEEGSQVIVVPWMSLGQPSGSSSRDVDTPFGSAANLAPPGGPGLIGGNYSHSDIHLHSRFIRGVFLRTPADVDVALYIDRSHLREHFDESNSSSSFGHGRIFFPFFGGPDDRAALEMVVQMCMCAGLEGVVVKVVKGEVETEKEDIEKPDAAYFADAHLPSYTASGFPDTIYGSTTTSTRLQSQTADHLIWNQYSSPPVGSPYVPVQSRITFSTITTPQPLQAVVQRASFEAQSTAASHHRMLVVVGRSRRLAAETHQAELKRMLEIHTNVSSEIAKTVGDVACAIMANGIKADLMVMQAGIPSSDA